MSWLAIVLFIIEHIPDLIKIIQEIIALLHGLPHTERVAARLSISDAIKTGNNDIVRAVVGAVRSNCEGVACPAEVKND